MMRYAVFVAFVALSLQASARGILPEEKALYRRTTKDNEIDISDNFEVKAPWYGQADQGYPKFDGNEFKGLLVILTAGLSELAHDYLKDEKDFPLILKTILKSGAKVDWKNFEEYLDFWGTAQITMQEAAEKEQKEYSDISDDSEVKAPWHGHADKGYPEFDGNPFKKSLVEISTWLSSLARDVVKNEKDVPLTFKQFLKSGQKTNWESFDEYLDFWGTTVEAVKRYIDHGSKDE